MCDQFRRRRKEIEDGMEDVYWKFDDVGYQHLMGFLASLDVVPGRLPCHLHSRLTSMAMDQAHNSERVKSITCERRRMRTTKLGNHYQSDCFLPFSLCATT